MTSKNRIPIIKTDAIQGNSRLRDAEIRTTFNPIVTDLEWEEYANALKGNTAEEKVLTLLKIGENEERVRNYNLQQKRLAESKPSVNELPLPSDYYPLLRVNQQTGDIETYYDIKPLAHGLENVNPEFYALALSRAGLNGTIANTASLISSGLLSLLGKLLVTSEFGGQGVDLASELITGKSFGENLMPNNPTLGSLFNPGYLLSPEGVINGYNKIGLGLKAIDDKGLLLSRKINNYRRHRDVDGRILRANQLSLILSYRDLKSLNNFDIFLDHYGQPRLPISITKYLINHPELLVYKNSILDYLETGNLDGTLNSSLKTALTNISKNELANYRNLKKVNNGLSSWKEDILEGFPKYNPEWALREMLDSYKKRYPNWQYISPITELEDGTIGFDYIKPHYNLVGLGANNMDYRVPIYGQNDGEVFGSLLPKDYTTTDRLAFVSAKDYHKKHWLLPNDYYSEPFIYPQTTEEYVNTLRHNNDYVMSLMPGLKGFGSGTLALSGNPHGTHDLDYITTLKNFLDNLLNKFSWKDIRNGNTFRTELKRPNGEYYGSFDSNGATPGSIDVNVIQLGVDGNAEGELAWELYRLVFPEKYHAKLLDFWNKMDKIPNASRADFERIASEMKLDVTPEELLEAYNPVLKTLMDAFESGKDKHMSRSLSNILLYNPSEVSKALSNYKKTLLGPNAIDLPTTPDMFKDVEANKRILKMFDTNYLKLGKNRTIEDSYQKVFASAVDKPEVMKNIVDYFYLLNGTFTRESVLDRLPQDVVGKQGLKKTLENSFTEWLNTKGGTANGIGRNTVTLGTASHGNVSSFILPRLSFKDTKNGEEFVTDVLRLLGWQGYVPTEAERSVIDQLYKKHLGNEVPQYTSLGELLYSIRDIGEGKFKTSKLFLKELQEQLGIKHIITGNSYGNARYSSATADTKVTDLPFSMFPNVALSGRQHYRFNPSRGDGRIPNLPSDVARFESIVWDTNDSIDDIIREINSRARTKEIENRAKLHNLFKYPYTISRSTRNSVRMALPKSKKAVDNNINRNLRKIDHIQRRYEDAKDDRNTNIFLGSMLASGVGILTPLVYTTLGKHPNDVSDAVLQYNDLIKNENYELTEEDKLYLLELLEYLLSLKEEELYSKFVDNWEPLLNELLLKREGGLILYAEGGYDPISNLISNLNIPNRGLDKVMNNNERSLSIERYINGPSINSFILTEEPVVPTKALRSTEENIDYLTPSDEGWLTATNLHYKNEQSMRGLRNKNSNWGYKNYSAINNTIYEDEYTINPDYTFQLDADQKYNNDYYGKIPSTKTLKGKNEHSGIIFHHTGHNLKSALNLFLHTKVKGSSHVIIDTDGTIYNLFGDEVKTMHAGPSRLNERDWANNYTLGIEFTGDTDIKHLTKPQLRAAMLYVLPRIKLYNIDLKNISSHYRIRKAYIDLYAPNSTATKPDINEYDLNVLLNMILKSGVYKKVNKK